jgi:anti-sigma factor RsiW
MSEACAGECREEKLHAYEVGILPEEEMHLFEIHLLECDACFERAVGFRDTSRLLRGDPEVRRVVREMAGEPDRSSPDGLRTRLRDSFSALSARVVHRRALRPLVVALLLLLAAWPAWHAWRGPADGPRVLQVVELYPLRGATVKTIDLSEGGDVEICFVLEGMGAAGACDVRILARDGFEVFSRPGFHGFNAEGLGTIRLPAALFSPGLYTLLLESPGSRDAAPPLQSYSIRVVP